MKINLGEKGLTVPLTVLSTGHLKRNKSQVLHNEREQTV